MNEKDPSRVSFSYFICKPIHVLNTHLSLPVRDTVLRADNLYSAVRSSLLHWKYYLHIQTTLVILVSAELFLPFKSKGSRFLQCYYPWLQSFISKVECCHDDGMWKLLGSSLVLASVSQKGTGQKAYTKYAVPYTFPDSLKYVSISYFN